MGLGWHDQNARGGLDVCGSARRLRRLDVALAGDTNFRHVKTLFSVD